MSIGDTLRFFRLKLNYTQKEMLAKQSDPSSYSRIENGKQSIKFSELEQILDRLSLTMDEFVSFSSLDCEQQEFRELFYYCATHLKNDTKRKKLLEYYEKITNKTNISSRELSNLAGIKNYFHHHWLEVTPFELEETAKLFAYLMDKSYYFQYDYALISNTIHLFTNKQVDLLFNHAFPIKDEKKRDATTKKFAYNAIINIISAKLYKHKYDSAERYIALAKKQDRNNTSYNYRMNLQYLYNLLQYLKTGELIHINKVYDFIYLLEDIGEYFHADQIKKEVKFLTFDNMTAAGSDTPIGLIKDD